MDARYENLFAHAVAVIRLHLSKKNNPLLNWISVNGNVIFFHTIEWNVWVSIYANVLKLGIYSVIVDDIRFTDKKMSNRTESIPHACVRKIKEVVPELTHQQQYQKHSSWNYRLQSETAFKQRKEMFTDRCFNV